MTRAMMATAKRWGGRALLVALCAALGTQAARGNPAPDRARPASRAAVRSSGADPDSLAGAADPTARPAAIGSGAARVTPMPDFTLPDLQGRSRRMSELDSMYCIVVYWSPECPECQQELPRLAALAQSHAADSVRLVGIVDGLVRDAALRFMERHGLDFTVLVDDGGHVADLLHADYTPMTWLVAGGVICFTNTGYDPASPEPLVAQLARVLPPR